jgi:hypothetical protein
MQRISGTVKMAACCVNDLSTVLPTASVKRLAQIHSSSKRTFGRVFVCFFFFEGGGW